MSQAVAVYFYVCVKAGFCQDSECTLNFHMSCVRTDASGAHSSSPSYLSGLVTATANILFQK